MKSTFLNVAILILLSLPAIWPIIEPGYFPMHDDTQVVRVDQMYQALKSGQFPVRFVKDLGYGYGYPIFNFYNPLPYYFGSTFMFFGLDALAATKLMFIFPVLLSGFTMWLLARKYFTNLAALAAAVFYVYAPYHAIQIYVRGAVAEYWAYAFLPLVIYAFLNRSRFLAPISLALLILSHNLTAFMFIPILGIFIFLLGHRSIRSILLALGLSAFFWLPALAEKNLTRVNFMVEQQFNPLDHFVYPDQLWSSSWGYAGSAPGHADGLSFMIGKLHIIFTLFSLTIIIFSQKLTKSTQRFLLFVTCNLLFAVFMLLPLSYFIWSNLDILRFLQFPWRYLTFVSLSTSIFAGLGIGYFLEIRSIRSILPVTSYALLIIFVLYSSKFFQPQFKYPISAPELLTEEQVKWVVSHRSDEYLPKGFVVPQTQAEALGAKNPHNQELVNALLSNTPLRTLANLISLIFLSLLMLQFSHVRFQGRGNLFRSRS